MLLNLFQVKKRTVRVRNRAIEKGRSRVPLPRHSQIPASGTVRSTKVNSNAGGCHGLPDDCRRLSGPVRFEKGMNLADRQRNPLFRLFPGEDAHLGISARASRTPWPRRTDARGRRPAAPGSGFGNRARNSRVAVKTKSGSVSNIFVTNLSVVAIVISGRLAVNAAPQVLQNTLGYLGSRISGRHPTGWARTAATTRLGARFRGDSR